MLSHWLLVATQVATQVDELVAELVFAMYINGTVHTSNKLLNLCPRMLLELFTLATCGQCESTRTRSRVHLSYGITQYYLPPDRGESPDFTVCVAYVGR